MATESAYTLGLDLGQRNDYTAIAVIETQCWASSDVVREYPWPGMAQGWNAPAAIHPEAVAHLFTHVDGRWPAKPALAVRHLERLRGVPYPDIVAHVGKLMQSEPLIARGVSLCVDATGVGLPVVDMFRQAGLHPLAVTIHGGDRTAHDRQGWRVPKRDLVAAVQTTLQTGRLQIAEGLEHAITLRNELQQFRVTIDPRTSHDSYSAWREADHDDLVLAVALAVFIREYVWKHWDRARLSAPIVGLDAA